MLNVCYMFVQTFSLLDVNNLLYQIHVRSNNLLVSAQDILMPFGVARAFGDWTHPGSIINFVCVCALVDACRKGPLLLSKLQMYRTNMYQVHVLNANLVEARIWNRKRAGNRWTLEVWLGLNSMTAVNPSSCWCWDDQLQSLLLLLLFGWLSHALGEHDSFSVWLAHHPLLYLQVSFLLLSTCCRLPSPWHMFDQHCWLSLLVLIHQNCHPQHAVIIYLSYYRSSLPLDCSLSIVKQSSTVRIDYIIMEHYQPFSMKNYPLTHHS